MGATRYKLDYFLSWLWPVFPHRVQARSSYTCFFVKKNSILASERATLCNQLHPREHVEMWFCFFLFQLQGILLEGRKEKKNILKYIASTKETHLWNLVRQLNCEDHCWRGYKWSFGHFVPVVQRSNSSWWGIKKFSKDYYGLEGF